MLYDNWRHCPSQECLGRLSQEATTEFRTKERTGIKKAKRQEKEYVRQRGWHMQKLYDKGKHGILEKLKGGQCG